MYLVYYRNRIGKSKDKCPTAVNTVLDRLWEPETAGSQQKITGISKLNNFSFSPGEVKVWQAFDIGPGKNVRLEGTNGNPYFVRCMLFILSIKKRDLNNF